MLEMFAVTDTGLKGGAVVVDGTRGELEEGSYLRALLHAEADEGEDAEFGGEGAGMREGDLLAIKEEGVELVDESGIKLEEGLVEAVHEGSILLSRETLRGDGAEQFSGLLGFDLALHEELEALEAMDVGGAEVDVDFGKALTALVDLYESAIGVGQLRIEIAQLCVEEFWRTMNTMSATISTASNDRPHSARRKLRFCWERRP